MTLQLVEFSPYRLNSANVTRTAPKLEGETVAKMNDQNLRPYNKNDPDSVRLARENGAKGGRKKAENARAEEEAQRVARALLLQSVPTEKGGAVRVVDALLQQVAVAAQKALKKDNPDPKCAEFLLKVAGMMPSEKRETTLKGSDEAPVRVRHNLPPLTPEQVLELVKIKNAERRTEQ